MGTLAKHIVITASLFLCAVAHSQSTFSFFNYVPSVGIDAPVFDAQGNRLFGDNYVAQLYGGPTMDALEIAKGGDLVTSMDPVPFLRIHNGQAGYFERAGEVTIKSAPFGGYAWLQVRAWDSRLGSTYEQVAILGLGGYGQSQLFYALGGDPLGTRPSQPLLGLQSFSLVPEPTTWALLALGSGIVFWNFRRRFRKNDS